MTYQPTVTGGGAAGVAFTLNITGHSLDIEVLTFNVTHTGSGGNAMRIGGYRDCKGTVNAHFDLDLPPYLIPPSIYESSTGVMLFWLSPSRAIAVPVIVKKVHFASKVDAAVEYSFDVEMAANYGGFSYPSL